MSNERVRVCVYGHTDTWTHPYATGPEEEKLADYLCPNCVLPRALMNSYEKLADAALWSGGIAIDRELGVCAVPDNLLVEWAANRHRVPRTWRLERDDGRSVSFYRIPDGMLEGVA